MPLVVSDGSVFRTCSGDQDVGPIFDVGTNHRGDKEKNPFSGFRKPFYVPENVRMSNRDRKAGNVFQGTWRSRNTGNSAMGVDGVLFTGGTSEHDGVWSQIDECHALLDIEGVRHLTRI